MATYNQAVTVSGGKQPSADVPVWPRIESMLLSTARRMRAAYDDRFAEQGLNLTCASILAYLAQFGSATQTQVADHLGIGRASTGSHIDRLQAAGLLERHPNPTDRRVWILALTPAGEAQIERIERIDKELRDQLRDGISHSERQVLADVLGRIEDNLSKTAVSRPSVSSSTSHTNTTKPRKLENP